MLARLIFGCLWSWTSGLQRHEGDKRYVEEFGNRFIGRNHGVAGTIDYMAPKHLLAIR